MSVDLDLVLSKVKSFSVEDLLTIQETVGRELRQKITHALSTEEIVMIGQPDNSAKASALYRRTPEEIEAHLAAIFTPEELAEIDRVDLSNLPSGFKSVTQIISEDRF